NWRTVLMGAAEPDGVKTTLVYKAPPTPVPTPLPPTDPIDSGTDLGSGSTDGFSTESTDGGTFGTTDPVGGGTEVPAPGEEGAPVDLPLEDAGLAGDELPAAPSIPGYVWLAILAGLMAFSLVRQVVLESAAGIRPDGVLAQIRKINTERRGATLTDIRTGPDLLAPLRTGFSYLGRGAEAVGSRFSSLSAKLPFRGRN
ncbi:MAG: hypothetical protein ACR2L3_05020, partial [Actinomycetota bacterium]